MSQSRPYLFSSSQASVDAKASSEQTPSSANDAKFMAAPPFGFFAEAPAPVFPAAAAPAHLINAEDFDNNFDAPLPAPSVFNGF